MQAIVVNDANIFIDLLDIGILNHFFQLSWEVHITDFVMFELSRENQRDAVEIYLGNKLHVASFEKGELCEILGLQKVNENNTKLSLADCSGWYYAKRKGYILLTGDGKLSSSPVKDEVRSILYVFDKLVKETILAPEVTAKKVEAITNNESTSS